MSHAYFDIAFTPTVQRMQTLKGSRASYARVAAASADSGSLTRREVEFIEARDGFYQATVSATGWPYVQFRGGPAGFLKVLDDQTIGYADFSGNQQYISAGNLTDNDRVAMILMDYAQQRRLKVMGQVQLVDARDDPALVARLRVQSYKAPIERLALITVKSFDWNCPQHITPRFTAEEFAGAQTQ
jgi:uncharacterized protein